MRSSITSIDAAEPAAERPARQVRTFSARQAVTLGAVHTLALVALLVPSATGLIAFCATYLLTGYGLTLGYHRGLSHGAFRAHPVCQAVLCTLGALAFQGGPITWVGFHRAHHRFTDHAGDPHAATRGLFWSHVEWALHKGPNGYRRQKLRHLTAGLERIAYLRALERFQLPLNLGLFAATWVAFGPAVALWAFPLRIVVLWHVTWCTNSLAHGAGSGAESPRNLGWLALIGFGEGLHANHHARPSAARFAFGPGEVDPGYWPLAALERARLVRVPNPSRPLDSIRSRTRTSELP
jgi:stearoyl-CoA desaturase (delta-9 desaturase)